MSVPVTLMRPAILPAGESRHRSRHASPLADVPPGFDVTPRLFFAAPAGMPATIAAHLGDAIQNVMAAPDLADLAVAQGAVPAYANAASLAAEMFR